jgi:hypothetical protein
VSKGRPYSQQDGRHRGDSGDIRALHRRRYIGPPVAARNASGAATPIITRFRRASKCGKAFLPRSDPRQTPSRAGSLNRQAQSFTLPE